MKSSIIFSLSRRWLVLGLVLALVLIGAGSAVAGDEEARDFSLEVNGQQVEVDMYIENGRTFIESGYMTDLLGVRFEQSYVALRDTLEQVGASVHWNSASRIVKVEIAEEVSEHKAQEIAVKAEEYLMDQNTYKMTGEGTMEIDFAMPHMPDIPEDMPEGLYEDLSGMEIPITIEGSVRYEPLTMYIVQKMDLPQPELPMNGEIDVAVMGDDEMLITEETIYQKVEEDQWVMMRYEDLGMTEMMQHYINMDPATSLELAESMGVSYHLVGEEVIDGEDYYVLNIQMDEESFRQLIEEMYGDLSDLMMLGPKTGMEELDEEELAEMEKELKEMMEQLMDSLQMTMDQYMYIHQETFETSQMTIDMEFGFNMAEELNGEVHETGFDMAMSLTMDLYDFGVEIEFPEIEDPMTWEEYMEKMMEEMENMEDWDVDMDNGLEID